MTAKYYLKSAILIFIAAFSACTADIKEAADIDVPAPGKKSDTGPTPTNSAQIYFQQDFNSSTDYRDYIGTGTNQLDGLSFNGNATLNTLNNTLQIVKVGGSGTNRASASKTTTPFNPTGVGGFLRFEMDIEISDNTPGTNVSNGFLFSVGMGMSGTAPADPGNTTVHSAIYISPVATTGAFVIRGRAPSGNISSDPLEGKHKIIWFINNSGRPAGYLAPDGETIGSVLDDAADVWVVDQEGNAKLMLDDVPALTPELAGLRQFKISNNANFVGTIDIDNILIAEEPVIPLRKITAITPVPEVSAPIKTIFRLLPLPKTVEVTLEDGEKQMAEVRWSEITKYNQYRLGEYEVRGDLIAGSGTVNSEFLFTTTKVKLRENINIINTFSPNGDGINDTWLIPDLQCYTRSSVEVLDRDGRRLFYSTDPTVGWDGKNKDGKVIPGSYFYIIKVPDLLLEERGTVTVIK